MKNKFIVLRGPSGSGKSTVANALKKDASTDTVIIDQDYFNHVLLKGIPDKYSLIASFLRHIASESLSAGYNVVLEGILREEKYGQVIKDIAANFEGESFFYYLDISQDETVRRHTTRDKVKVFDANEMLEWYSLASPLGTPDEVIFDESITEQDLISQIKEQTKI